MYPYVHMDNDWLSVSIGNGNTLTIDVIRPLNSKDASDFTGLTPYTAVSICIFASLTGCYIHWGQGLDVHLSTA